MKYLFTLCFFSLGFSLFAQNYSEDIAPLIYKHCSNCHRPGEIAPFALTNYNEVASWASTIKHVTEIKYMPPWKPDPKYQQYQLENYLSDDEIATIGNWVLKGMPQGDPSKEPAFPNFPKGSQIGTPDLAISFSQSYVHKGNDIDEYRYFVLPTNLTEDKELIALEMRPGNSKIVHHTLFWADETGKARAEDAKSPEYGYTGGGSAVSLDNQLPGYVPGQKPNVFTSGMSQTIKKGSDLVLQMHYAPSSIDESDSSTVNLFFAKKPAPRKVQNKIMLPYDLVNGPFIIPANQVKEFHGVYKIPFKVSLLGIWPHCHKLGKKWEAYAKLPDGSQIPLIKIEDWDFNWQGGYYFKKLIVLPAGSEIHAFATYDNTINNPVNPNDPPKSITWGEGTSDEMYYLPLTYVVYQPGDENIILNSSKPDLNEAGIENIESKLYPIYPNPVNNQSIQVGFVLNKDQDVAFNLCTQDGKQIINLHSKKMYLQGQHSLKFTIPDNIPEGTYLIKMITTDRVWTERIVVLRD